MTPAAEAVAILARLGWSRRRAAAELGTAWTTVQRWHVRARYEAAGEEPPRNRSSVPGPATLRLLRHLDAIGSR